MQYAIDLPADYDMEIIRRRVRENGHKTDGFHDLEMKAYLIAEKGKYGNAGNQYAPFYLWRSVEGMNEFLLHGPFNNILQSFGWPQVRTWFVIQSAFGKIPAPGIACLTNIPILPHANFEEIMEKEREAALQTPASTSFVSAYNPGTWEICRFWMKPPGQVAQRERGTGSVYDIHHVSVTPCGK